MKRFGPLFRCAFLGLVLVPLGSGPQIIRAGSELCALGTHQKSLHEFLARIRKQGLKDALQERDAPFADYRTKKAED